MTLSIDPTRLSATLALVCKRPAVGMGKQRIAASLGADTALEIATHLLNCAVEDLHAWHGPVAILVAGVADTTWAQSLCPRATVAAQSNGNLGRRLMHGAEALDTHPIIFIGADCPALDQRYLTRCELALQTHDVVLGQASDGGVVAMASRAAWPDIEDLPWSTAALGRALFERCLTERLSVARLPALTDIDHAEQLPALAHTLRHDSRPARAALRQYLDTLTAGAGSPAASA
ncbi:MAG: DUF2064 domain-containing protein [Pseudomonadota bacterium]